MAMTCKDFKIVKIEKTRNIKKYDHYNETLYSDGSRSSSYRGSSYDTIITTNITYDDNSVVSFETNLAVLEGWTVRSIFDDDNHIYDICLENNLILWTSKRSIPKFSFATKSLTPELDTIIDLYKDSGDIYMNYNTTKKGKFIICYNERPVKLIEKIPMVKSDGSSYVSTRVFYNDNSSDLFEMDVPIQTGWRIRSIYYGFGSADLPLRKRIVVESNYTLFSDYYYHDDIENAIFSMIADKTQRKYEKYIRIPRAIGVFAAIILAIVSLLLLIAYEFSFERLIYALKDELSKQRYEALYYFPGCPLGLLGIGILFLVDLKNHFSFGKRKAKKWINNNLKSVREIKRDFSQINK